MIFSIPVLTMGAGITVMPICSAPEHSDSPPTKRVKLAGLMKTLSGRRPPVQACRAKSSFRIFPPPHHLPTTLLRCLLQWSNEPRCCRSLLINSHTELVSGFLWGRQLPRQSYLLLSLQDFDLFIQYSPSIYVCDAAWGNHHPTFFTLPKDLLDQLPVELF